MIGSARWFAPGRVNLIGDHTDYQLGWVLPFAIAPGATVSVDLTHTSTLQARSSVFGQAPDRALAALPERPHPDRHRGWAVYVEGAVDRALREGLPIKGVRVDIETDLPVGSGLASSAAVTCATLAALYDAAGVETTPGAVATMAQQVENEYVGAGVGYMDPAAVMFGRAGHALVVDTRDRAVEAVPLVASRHGLTLLLVDTHERHRTSGSDYRDRVSQCRQAAELLEVESLRDVLDPGAVAAIPDPLLRSRARHVVTENARVLAVVELLRAERVRDIGDLMAASHASLRDDFEVSTPALDAVVWSAMHSGALGARATGAGFGGSALVLADTGRLPEITGAVGDAFARHRWREPTTQRVTPSHGAHRLT